MTSLFPHYQFLHAGIQWVSTFLFSLHVTSLFSCCLSFSLCISMEMKALPLSSPAFFSNGVDVNETSLSLSLSPRHSFVLSNRGTQCFLIHLWKLGYTSVSFLSLCLAAILENVLFYLAMPLTVGVSVRVDWWGLISTVECRPVLASVYVFVCLCWQMRATLQSEVLLSAQVQSGHLYARCVWVCAHLAGV